MTAPRDGYSWCSAALNRAAPASGASPAATSALEEAGVAVEIGDVVQVAVNRHDPDRPTVGIWFAARLVTLQTEPHAGDDAIAVGWFDPANPPPLAFPTDASVLAALATRHQG